MCIPVPCWGATLSSFGAERSAPAEPAISRRDPATRRVNPRFAAPRLGGDAAVGRFASRSPSATSTWAPGGGRPLARRQRRRHPTTPICTPNTSARWPDSRRRNAQRSRRADSCDTSGTSAGPLGDRWRRPARRARVRSALAHLDAVGRPGAGLRGGPVSPFFERTVVRSRLPAVRPPAVQFPDGFETSPWRSARRGHADPRTRCRSPKRPAAPDVGAGRLASRSSC
jgi:hypothetical protein